jgi:hypothetical protein
LVNALVFQEILSRHQIAARSGRTVKTLQQVLDEDNLSDAFSDHWKFILNEIDYYPIFHIARGILIGFSADQSVDARLRALAHKARDIVRLRAAFRHDLMGRVYHTLLAEAKFLGTYYTSVPAATLLLKLALDPARWQSINWASVDQIGGLRVGDLACGTGTLLMAAADVITDNYARALPGSGMQPDLDRLHRILIEKVIHGYDVLPSAIHLTASTLATRAPQIRFTDAHLYSVPLGGADRRLGSIEFLGETAIQIPSDPFSPPAEAQQVTATGTTRRLQASLPDLDLCVMNPPFTRSVGGNLLFGSLPSTERRLLQQRLARILRGERTIPVLANSTAGLGSVFVAVANPHIKPGGRIALVLPRTLI